VSDQVARIRPINSSFGIEGLFPIATCPAHAFAKVPHPHRRLTDLFVQPLKFEPLFRCRCFDVRRRVAFLNRAAVFRNVVEVGEDLIEFFLRDRIVLVIVTACAAHGQTEPDGCCRIDPVNDVFDLVLFRNDAAFGIAAMIAIESGCDQQVTFSGRNTALAPRVELGFGNEQITGKLLGRKLVEGHVCVVSVDHPIAPPPHGTGAVVLVAAGIGVAGRVQPANGHSFPVARRFEQPVDHSLIGTIRFVGEKRIDFLLSRRQAGQVERNAADQSRLVGLG